MRSSKDGKQKPVYFMSKVLTEAETRYTNFERIALALKMAAKKLCLYFQAHTIVVLTTYPIRAILHKPEASTQLLKWAVEFREFDIEYLPRSTIKGQILVDLNVKMSNVQPRDLCEPSWLLETDGSLRAVGGGAGMIL